ncbi:ergothioneine biosynthesis protein EgtB [Alphaproteobacteria bacterium]|nr:ergothioneine biosynthesis protein EgtB [Alphaproteobacteria bacterium]
MSFLISYFLKVRKKTSELVSKLEPEDMIVQSNDFVSPIKWHLGHTTWFFENFILQKSKDYKKFDKSFNYIFNSYYNGVGTYNPKEKRGTINRPLLEQVIKYRKHVDQNITDLLDKKNLTSKFKFLIELGINHEQQHQELILMDVLNNFFNNPLKPEYLKPKKNKRKNHKHIVWKNKTKTLFNFGVSDNSFHYDNESPKNSVEICPFELNIDFVSNNEWLEFIHNDGYNRPELWLSDGWDFIKKYDVKKPLYWLDNKFKFSFFGVERIDGSEPVSHISFYEADAFSRFKKKRLPTEFEIEYFLTQNKKKGNLLENGNFKEISINKQNAIENSYGNLWCWTSSNYLPYSGYKPFSEKLSEYNQKFMCNQFVLKGGSYATPKNHIRSTYRNFYYPSDRWQFSGLRLASDIK